MGVGGWVMKRAIFLDRDGVINQTIVKSGKPYPPKCLDDLQIIHGVMESLQKLNELGFYLYVITNQPDVARGKLLRAEVEKINTYIMKILPISDVHVCYHDDIDNCSCRKPKPGLLYKVRDRYNVNLEGSYMIGDRWKDIKAGQNAGCKTIFIDYNYRERKPEPPANFSCSNLIEASDWILNNYTDK